MCPQTATISSIHALSIGHVVGAPIQPQDIYSAVRTSVLSLVLLYNSSMVRSWRRRMRI